jgi:hypothetical protein
MLTDILTQITPSLQPETGTSDKAFRSISKTIAKIKRFQKQGF